MRNFWLNELRKHRTDPQLVEVDANSLIADGLTYNVADAHKILERKEDAVRVRAAISTLPSELREILVLREFEELSYQEIATVLDCPASTVMSRLGRARAKLNAMLSAEPNTPKRSEKVRRA